MDNILLSRTPSGFLAALELADTSLALSLCVHSRGGNSNRVKATLAVFLISGLQHELLVSLAIGRITGHQTAFFMLNALGVIASPAMERFGRRGILARSLM